MGGRNNGYSHIPQRSRLIADREHRDKRASHTFGLLREVDGETTDNIYEITQELQRDGFISENVELFNHDLYSSTIETQRVRRCLVAGLAGGFSLRRDLPHVERAMPGRGRKIVRAKIKDVSTTGPNRNVLVAHITDKDGVLVKERKAASMVLGKFGIKLPLNGALCIPIGESKAGLSVAERDIASKAIFGSIGGEGGIDIPLGPTMLEYNGARIPLECAKQLG